MMMIMMMILIMMMMMMIMKIENQGRGWKRGGPEPEISAALRRRERVDKNCSGATRDILTEKICFLLADTFGERGNLHRGEGQKWSNGELIMSMDVMLIIIIKFVIMTPIVLFPSFTYIPSCVQFL